MPASISALPQELIYIITTYLQDDGWIDNGERHRERIAPFATISLAFQAAIERFTFANLHIKSTELDIFKSTLTKSRRAKLARLSFDIVLPEYDDIIRHETETASDFPAYAHIFGEAMVHLFTILHSWENDPSSRSPIRTPDERARLITLDLDSFSSSNPNRCRVLLDENDTWCTQFTESVLHFPRYPMQLPKVENVFAITASSRRSGRSFDGRAIAEIAAALPKLENFSATLGDTIPAAMSQRQYRMDLARLFAKVPTTNLRKFSLFFNHYIHGGFPGPGDNGQDDVRLSSAVNAPDELCRAIYNISLAPQLEEFNFHAPFGSLDFFGSPHDSEQFSPNLTEFILSLGPHFVDKDNYTPESYFIAASQMTTRMPGLLQFVFELDWPVNGIIKKHVIEFIAPGKASVFAAQSSTPHNRGPSESRNYDQNRLHWKLDDVSIPNAVTEAWKRKGVLPSNFKVITSNDGSTTPTVSSRSTTPEAKLEVAVENDDLLRLQQKMMGRQL